MLDERIYGVKQVPLLPAGDQIRALLAAPSNSISNDSQQAVPTSQLQSATRPQEDPPEKKWQTSNGRMIPPIVALPTSSSKKTRLVGDPIASSPDGKPLRSARGFLASESKTNSRLPTSSLERSNQRSDKQPNVDEKPEPSPARNVDILAMAQELHLMMRKLQASLTK